MKTFAVEVEITFTKTIRVKAKTKDEAIEQAELSYKQYPDCIGINGIDAREIIKARM